MIGKPNPNKANKVRKLNNKPPLIKANILPSRLPSKRKAMCWSSFHKQDAKPHRECNLSRNLQESQRISMGHQWWWIANRPPRNSTGVSALVSKSSKHMSQLWLSSHMQVSVNGATPQLSSMGFSEFPWTIQRAWGIPYPHLWNSPIWMDMGIGEWGILWQVVQCCSHMHGDIQKWANFGAHIWRYPKVRKNDEMLLRLAVNWCKLSHWRPFNQIETPRIRHIRLTPFTQ